MILFPVIVFSWDDTDWDNGYNSGKISGDFFIKKIDTDNKINDRFVQPITSDDKSMKTIDDNKSFSAQLTAPSSNAFLTVFAAPGATGDLFPVIIKQDTNFDGIFNYTYNFPICISGICANGFISSDIGTWNNRKHYTYEADNNGRITNTLEPSILSLSACYCINASCGSNLMWNNLSVILKDIGSGIVAAIQKKKPNYIITSVSISDTSITYYGQDSRITGGGNQVYASGTPNPESYINNPNNLSSDGSIEFNNQINDSESYTYLTMSASDQNYNEINCFIINDVQIDQLTETVGYQVSFYIGYDNDGKTKNCFWAKNDETCMDKWVNGGGWENCKNVNEAYIPDIVNSIVNGAEPIISYEIIHKLDGLGYPYCYKAGSDDPHAFWRVKAYTQDVSSGYSVSVEEPLLIGTKDVPSVASNNTCNNIDDSCNIKEEKICNKDGSACIYTIKNFISTGLNPFPFCTTFTTSIDSYTACMNGSEIIFQNSSGDAVTLLEGDNIWWRIERVYQCKTSNTYNFDAIGDRIAHIHNTLSDNTNNMSYQDLYTDSGETTQYNISLPPRIDPGNCEKACRVRTQVQDTQAAVSGHTAQYRLSVNSVKEVIKKCYNEKCPLEDGEILIEDCTCLNYFLEAASIMQSIDEAGSDIICSE